VLQRIDLGVGLCDGDAGFEPAEREVIKVAHRRRQPILREHLGQKNFHRLGTISVVREILHDGQMKRRRHHANDGIRVSAQRDCFS
jgi:hypothetical protein